MQFSSRRLEILKYSTLGFLVSSFEKNTNLAMFGKAKRAQTSSETSRPFLSFIGQRFIIKGCVKKIACLSVSEFAIFSNPTIRNLWGDTESYTGAFSLPKKACRKGKLHYPPSAKEPLVGCNGEGVQGGGR